VKHHRWPTWLAVAILLLISGCSNSTPTSTTYTLELALTPTPPTVGETTAAVSIHDADNAPLTGATVNLEARLNNSELAPILVQALESDPGFYTAVFNFTATGDWTVKVIVQLPDERTLERSFDVPGVGSAP